MLPRFLENPNLKKKVVVTIDGNKEYRAHCRLKKGRYYVKNKDCFEIDGNWYTLDSGLIIFDNELNEMVIKARAPHLIHGIIDYKEDDVPVLGYYSPNANKNTVVVDKTGKQYFCITETVAIKGGNSEDIAHGVFVHSRWLKEKFAAPIPEKKGRRGAQFIPPQRVAQGQQQHWIQAPVVNDGPPRAAIDDILDMAEDDPLDIAVRVMQKRMQEQAAQVQRQPAMELGNPAAYGELSQYGVEDDPIKFDTAIENYNKYELSYSKDVKRYAKFLCDRTFGIEYETRKGFVPTRILSRNGLIPLRDGSLHGGVELSTVPISGAKGLQTTSITCNELAKRCTVNLDCSLHIHFGTLQESRLLIIALYHLCKRVQDELFTMFPYYKTNPKGIKGDKNYCQKLKPLTTKLLPKKLDKENFQKYVDYYYTRIFTFLLEGTAPNQHYNKKVAVHPVAQKWNRMSRYYWFNLMPMMLSPRRTVEFRVHQGTVNPIKTINWLFICNAIIGYAQSHSKEILTSADPIPIKEILDWYGVNFKTETATFLSEYLNAYFKSRQEEFQKDYIKGDLISDWDLEKDRFYTFNYKGVSSLF